MIRNGTGTTGDPGEWSRTITAQSLHTSGDAAVSLLPPSPCPARRGPVRRRRYTPPCVCGQDRIPSRTAPSGRGACLSVATVSQDHTSTHISCDLCKGPCVVGGAWHWPHVILGETEDPESPQRPTQITQQVLTGTRVPCGWLCPERPIFTWDALGKRL